MTHERLSACKSQRTKSGYAPSKRVRTIRWWPSSAKKNLRGLIEPAPWDDNERPASGKRQAAKSGKTTRFSSQNKPRGNRNITAKSRCHREKPPLTFSRCRESEHLMGHHKRIQKREQSKQLFPLQNNTMKQVNVLAEEVKLKIV